jgi:hypothetical protein
VNDIMNTHCVFTWAKQNAHNTALIEACRHIRDMCAKLKEDEVSLQYATGYTTAWTEALEVINLLVAEMK